MAEIIKLESRRLPQVKDSSSAPVTTRTMLPIVDERLAFSGEEWCRNRRGKRSIEREINKNARKLHSNIEIKA